MSNYNLELEFARDDSKPTPLPSVARIYIRTSTSNTATGLQYISPDCLTEGELNYAIDALIQELEAIRKKARRKFAADDKYRAERVAVRNGVRIECSQLSDSELAELTQYLNRDARIEDVVLPRIEVKPKIPGQRFSIQASAAPFYLIVKLAHEHWKAGVVVGGVAVHAYDYVEKRIKEWSKSRANRYETVKLYDHNDEVVKVVRRRKKPE